MLSVKVIQDDEAVLKETLIRELCISHHKHPHYIDYWTGHLELTSFV